jgi:phage gp16-like protein
MMNADVRRKKELALIHMAKSDLRMSREDYEFVLHEVTGKASAALLNERERTKLINHFKTKGFKIKSGGAAVRFKANLGHEGLKMLALWGMLHDLGAVKNPSEDALHAYIKRITKVDSPKWVNGAQVETVIETLKKWSMRYLPDRVKAMAQHLSSEIRAGRIVLEDATTQRIYYYVSQAQMRATFEPTWDAYELLKQHAAYPAGQSGVE